LTVALTAAGAPALGGVGSGGLAAAPAAGKEPEPTPAPATGLLTGAGEAGPKTERTDGVDAVCAGTLTVCEPTATPGRAGGSLGGAGSGAPLALLLAEVGEAGVSGAGGVWPCDCAPPPCPCPEADLKNAGDAAGADAVAELGGGGSLWRGDPVGL
jgi:hypothetical protein